MLTNQQVIEILRDWGFLDRPVQQSIARAIELPNKLHADLILIIQGVRRCGKSTLLTQLPKRYNLDLSSCYYCNFEDPRLIGSLDHSLLSQISAIARENIPYDKPCYFFFDEIQNVQGWEKWLHAKLERSEQDYFIVTGSNSCLLSGEFSTSLTGRHLSIDLFPFSFGEYKLLFPDKALEEYLLTGGFPKALTFEQPYRLLHEYFNDIILRDVLRRVQTRTPDAIKQVVKMAFGFCGSELSYRKISAAVDLSVDTVKLYLEACEQAYLLFACPFFSFSERKSLLRAKKYYPVDPGLRYAVTNTNNRDFGKSLELLAFLYLRQSFEKVYYWQEIHKGEVGFIVTKGEKIIPYQVTWKQPEKRHEISLSNFYKAFPQAEEAVFITKDNFASLLNY